MLIPPEVKWPGRDTDSLHFLIIPKLRVIDRHLRSPIRRHSTVLNRLWTEIIVDYYYLTERNMDKDLVSGLQKAKLPSNISQGSCK
jgi:hypothetical protein